VRGTVGLYLTVALSAAACTGSNLPTGTVWTFQTERPWLAGTSQALTPVVDHDSVYFCGGYSTNERAAIHAIALADGTVKWQRPVGSCQNPIAVADGTLVVISRRDAGARCVIEGYDPTDGRSKWRHERDSRNCARFATAAGNVVLLTGSDDNSVAAIRAVDGTLNRFDVGGTPRGTGRVWLAASDGVAWFGVDRHVWRWISGDDKPHVAVDLPEPAGQPDHAIVVQRVVILGERRPGRLRAFDLEKGTLLWQQRAFPQVLSLTSEAERLYANIWRRRFELIAIDPATGAERWTAADGGFYPPNATAEGWLDANGQFSVFTADPTTGRIFHTIESDDEVTTTPISVRDSASVVLVDSHPRPHAVLEMTTHVADDEIPAGLEKGDRLHTVAEIGTRDQHTRSRRIRAREIRRVCRIDSRIPQVVRIVRGVEAVDEDGGIRRIVHRDKRTNVVGCIAGLIDHDLMEARDHEIHDTPSPHSDLFRENVVIVSRGGVEADAKRHRDRLALVVIVARSNRRCAESDRKKRDHEGACSQHVGVPPGL
jgi:outer membrane protein assembly factor BamB